MLVEIVVAVLVIGAFVGGILVYRNNKKRIEASVAKINDVVNTVKNEVKK